MATGCTGFLEWFDDPGQPAPKTANQQLSDGRVAFEKKLTDSKGLSLAQLRRKWGSLEPGISSDNLTVYRWSQTAKLTPPLGAVSQASSAKTTSSCLAMFIVDPKGHVVDAASEGQCFIYRLMPSWNPLITQSTDGKTGVVN